METQAEAEKCVHRAMQERVSACTAFNAKSSRSHVLLIITCGDKQLGIADLAGSERVNTAR